MPMIRGRGRRGTNSPTTWPSSSDPTFVEPLYTLPTGMTYNSTTDDVDGAPYDVTYSAPASSVSVTDQGSRALNQTALQAAYDTGRAAVGGRTITLTAGVDYGKLTLGPSTGGGWVYLVSSALASLPTGTRVVSGTNCFKLSCYTSGDKALDMNAGANKVRIVGCNFTVDAAVTCNNVIYLNLDSGMGTVSNCPSDIILDRCYMDVDDTKDRNVGIRWEVRGGAIVDSSILGFRQPGVESKAMLTINCQASYFYNTRFSAAAINIMHGGGDSPITNEVPADICYDRCVFDKLLTWNPNHASYDGRNGVAKNNWEVKHGERILVHHCIIENCWVDGQNGFGILIKTTNQDGSETWARTKNITFRYNAMYNIWGGPNIAGHSEPQPVAEYSNRVDFHHNLLVMADMASMYAAASGQNGPGAREPFAVYSEAGDVRIKRNTMAYYGSRTLTFSGDKIDGLTLTDNLAFHTGTSGNGAGFLGDGTFTPAAPNDGTAVLDAYTLSYTFNGNAFYCPVTVSGAVATSYNGQLFQSINEANVYQSPAFTTPAAQRAADWTLIEPTILATYPNGVGAAWGRLSSFISGVYAGTGA